MSMLFLGVWYVTLLSVLFALSCLFMILVILIQKPRGDGLSGAFGGAGGSAQAAFGAKTGDVLTWFTVFCFAAFLVFAMGLTWALKPTGEESAPVWESEVPGTQTTAPTDATVPAPPAAPDASADTPGGVTTDQAAAPATVPIQGAAPEIPDDIKFDLEIPLEDGATSAPIPEQPSAGGEHLSPVPAAPEEQP
jgi:preprotein translocase subunit SecG